MENIMTRTNTGENGLTENRKDDHNREEFFWPIFDDNIYSKIPGIEYERKIDKPTQTKGIDIIAMLNEQKYIIDEKTQSSKAFIPNKNKHGFFTYIENGVKKTVKSACTPTFCLELISNNLSKYTNIDRIYNTREFDIPTEIFGTKKFPGWFIDDNKITTHYLLVWPHNLNVIELALVNRQAIFDDFKNRGVTSELLTDALIAIKNEAKRIVESPGFIADKNAAPLKYYDDCFKNNKGEYDAWFTSSVYNLAEAPVNLVCRKEFLFNLPETIHGLILPPKKELIKL